MPTNPTPITALPAAPDRSDRATFSSRATAMFDALKNLFVSEANALASTTYTNANEAVTAASSALSSANAAATSASNASTSAGNAATSASSAASLVEKYLGARATDPTQDNSGNALTAGDWYINTGTGLLRVYTGSAWTQGISALAGVSSLNGLNGDLTGFASLNTQQSFTKPQRPSLSTETAPTTNTITWDLTTDQILRINLNANITTFNLTGTLSSLAGNQYQVIVRYNGGSSITWNANIKWPAGTAPTLTGTSGKVDTFTFVVSSTDGTNFYLLNTGKTQNL